MNVIVCHNFYQEPGGEDQVFRDEAALLEDAGHAVTRYTVHNDAVKRLGALSLVGKTLWNREAAGEIAELVRRHRAEVVHFHNTFPLISPAAYSAARSAGAAVVQTLHNYRLACPNAMFFRDGRPCEDCLGKAVPWPGVAHACYRGSRAASAATAGMLAFHRLRGTWRDDVDAYVALTDFARGKLVRAGLPADRVVVKPNFARPDPGPGGGSGGYALFVGRLAPGKGLEIVLQAWAEHRPPLPLKVVGDGPLGDLVRQASESCRAVQWLGRRPLDEVYQLMGEAAALVLPSVWYEGFPKALVESFAKGTPVVASRLGSLAELVGHGRTGLHFEPGDAADLAAQVRRVASSPDEAAHMRREARREFERKYTAEWNLDLLLAVYESAVRRFRAGLAKEGNVPRFVEARSAKADPT